MTARNIYYSLIVSLIWGGLFCIPVFHPETKALAYIFITLILSTPNFLTLKRDIQENEAKKEFFTLKDFFFISTISTSFIALVILNELIDNMFPSFYPLRYVVSSLILINWGFNLWKIWFNENLKNSLSTITKNGMFKELSSGVVHFNPKGIWSKKVYVLNTIDDKQKILSMYYSYDIAVVLSIALSVWQESWLLLFGLNVGLYALVSYLTNETIKNLKQIDSRNSFKHVIESQAKEINYFFLLTSLPIFSFIAWRYFKKVIFLKDDMLHDIFGAIVLAIVSLFIALVLYYKIQITIKKSKNT